MSMRFRDNGLAEGGDHLQAAVKEFWSEMYRSAYADCDAALDRSSLETLLDQTEAMFRYRDHLAAVEMPLEALAGMAVLEIGCGTGSHSAMFVRHGAHVTALDLSYDRVRATQAKLDLLGTEGSAALQGDAERLPFGDNTFDIVYSNGVLHHSPDTARAVADLRRVLKPGGRAVVMLYCKSSINWWLTLFLGYGVFRGRLRYGTAALGSASEWAGRHPQRHENPITRAYTRSEILRLFKSFTDVRVRKSDFSLVHLPKLGKLWRRFLERKGAFHPGGILPYGAPWPIATPFELWLGRYAGWAWNITATKPLRD